MTMQGNPTAAASAATRARDLLYEVVMDLMAKGDIPGAREHLLDAGAHLSVLRAELADLARVNGISDETGALEEAEDIASGLACPR